MSVMHGTGEELKIARLDDNFGGGETEGAEAESGTAKPASKGGEINMGKFKQTPEPRIRAIGVF